MSSEKGRVLVVGDGLTLPLFRSVGLETVEAEGDDNVISAVREAAARGDVSLVIVLKHVVKDPDRIVGEAQKYGIPILVLPTIWAPAEKINVERLLAKALGLG